MTFDWWKQQSRMWIWLHTCESITIPYTLKLLPYMWEHRNAIDKHATTINIYANSRNQICMASLTHRIWAYKVYNNPSMMVSRITCEWCNVVKKRHWLSKVHLSIQGFRRGCPTIWMHTIKYYLMAIIHDHENYCNSHKYYLTIGLTTNITMVYDYKWKRISGNDWDSYNINEH